MLGWRGLEENIAYDVGLIINFLIDSQASTATGQEVFGVSELAAIRFQDAAWPEGLVPTTLLFNGSGYYNFLMERDTFKVRLQQAFTLFPMGRRKSCDLLGLAALQ